MHILNYAACMHAFMSASERVTFTTHKPHQPMIIMIG
jgi:hypothetical protein